MKQFTYLCLLWFLVGSTSCKKENVGPQGPQGQQGPQGGAGGTGPQGGQGNTGNPGTSAVQEWAYFADKKPSGTSGGQGIGNQWKQRDFSLIEKFPTSGGSIGVAANSVILSPGTYYVKASAPAYKINSHRIIFSPSSSQFTGSVLLGSTAYARSGTFDASASIVDGILTIQTSQQFGIFHWIELSDGSLDFGIPANSGAPEVYTQLTIQKLK